MEKGAVVLRPGERAGGGVLRISQKWMCVESVGSAINWIHFKNPSRHGVIL